MIVHARRLLMFGGAVGLALFVFGCGGDDLGVNLPTATQNSNGGGGNPTSPASGDGSGTACQLISTSDLSAVVNDTMNDGREEDATAPFYSCDWTDADDTLEVNISVYSGAAAEQFYEISTSVTDVDGVGDKAHWQPDLDELEFLRGNTDVTIAVIDFNGTSSDAALAEAKAVASKVLDNL